MPVQVKADTRLVIQAIVKQFQLYEQLRTDENKQDVNDGALWASRYGLTYGEIDSAANSILSEAEKDIGAVESVPPWLATDGAYYIKPLGWTMIKEVIEKWMQRSGNATFFDFENPAQSNFSMMAREGGYNSQNPDSEGISNHIGRPKKSAKRKISVGGSFVFGI